MYRDFYGLKDNPFRLSPDLRYFFISPRVEKVIDQLFYGLEQGMGFMMVVGEVGVGKTSLLRLFLSMLDDSVERAYLFNPTLSTPEDLLSFLLLDLKANGRGVPKGTKVQLLNRFHRYLLDRYQKGKKVLFILDDAQAAPDFILEELRLLSNFETDEEKLFQILLVGQGELEERIREKLPQLYQRIPIRAILTPFKDREETEAYLRYRLSVAGGNPLIFTKKAIKEIHKASKGIPRLINLIAERSLIAGYIKGRREIGKREVRMAVEDLRL